MNPYLDLKKISDSVYSGRRNYDWSTDALNLLGKYGIRVRNKDGMLKCVTFSIPKTENNCFVLGLRYTKKDGTSTEDLFVFRKGSQKIQPYYKGRLEKLFKEYKGTHKQQITD